MAKPLCERVTRLETNHLWLDRLMVSEFHARDVALRLSETRIDTLTRDIRDTREDALRKEHEFVTHVQYDAGHKELASQITQINLNFNNFKSSMVGITIGATATSAALGGLITALVMKMIAGK